MVQAFLEVLFEILVSLTGHILLWVISLGRWRPDERRDSIATLVGLVFWVCVAGVVFVVLR